MNYFVAIFSLVLGIACFWISIKMMRLYLKVIKWQRLNATVESKEIVVHPKYSTSRTPYGLKVNYTYMINGISYSGHMVYLAELLGGQVNHMKKDAERRLRNIESSMKIFVNPNNPNESVIYCDGIILYGFVFFMGIIALIISLSNLL